MRKTKVQKIIDRAGTLGIYCIESEAGKHTAYATQGGEIGIFQKDGKLRMSIEDAKIFLKEFSEVIEDYEERVRLGLELPPKSEPKAGKNAGRRRLHLDEEELEKALKSDMTQAEIAKLFGVSQSYICTRRKELKE